MKIKKFLPLLLISILVGCEKPEEAHVITHMVPGTMIDDEFVLPMNTVTQLRMFYDSQYGKVNIRFDEIVINLSKEVDRYHYYENINNIKVVNDSCGKDEFIKISDELFEMLELGIKMTKLTEGKFNLAMGNVIDLYKDKLDEDLVGTINTLPEPEILSKAMKSIPSYTDIDSVIELDYEKKMVKLNKYNDENVIISLGGIAKGFVMQKAYDYLKGYNYPSIIDAGSSTMAMIGEKPSEKNKNWNISFALPTLKKEQEITATMALLGDHFISTSGDYQQYFFYNDEHNNQQMMHHIIDPNTGISNHYIRSVTLTSKKIRLDVLDALSTAIFNCYNDEEVLKLIDKLKKEYDGDLQFVLIKPFIENKIIDYDKFNILSSKSFEDNRISDYSNKIINKQVLENY